MLKHKMSAVLIITVLLLSGCGAPKLSNEKDAAQEGGMAVTIQKPEKGDIMKTTYAIGSIEAAEEYDIQVRGTGTVESVRVQVGDRVAAGQVLMTMDSESIQNSTDIQRSQSDSQIALNKVQLEDAQKNYDRVKTLAESGVETSVSLEQAASKLEQAQVNLSNAQSNQALTLKDFNRQLSDRTVTSPVSGKVASVSVDVGDSVNGSTPIIQVINDTSMVAVIKVTEEALKVIKVGQKTQVYPNGKTDNPKDGTVVTVNTVPETGSSLYKVEIALNDGNDLISGTYIEVKIVTEKHEGVLLVDKTALVNVEDSEGCFVEVDGNASFVPLDVGFEENGKIEVLSGLTAESHVVVKGQDYLKDGEKVIVTP